MVKKSNKSAEFWKMTFLEKEVQDEEICVS